MEPYNKNGKTHFFQKGGYFFQFFPFFPILDKKIFGNFNHV